MLFVTGIGKVVSNPVEEENSKGKQCRLEVNMKDVKLVKLVAFGKSAEAMVIDELVYFVGELSYVGDTNQHLQLTASYVQKVTDGLSMVTGFVTGGSNYYKHEEEYSQFQIGSYNGLTKKFTNVSGITSSKLRTYMTNKRIATVGIIEGKEYTKKDSDEKAVAINQKVRNVEITERKEVQSGSQSSKANAEYNRLDNIPF